MVSVILLAVIYLSFISLGLPDGVFGVAWPDMRVDFSVPLQTAGIISILLMSCSAFSSFMNGKVLRRFGTGTVTFISCLMTGLALIGNSIAPSFGWLVLLTFPLGLGQGAVDSSLNNYVASHYTSRHMNWLHCCWGIGATLGPFIMTKTLSAGRPWRNGYGTIGTIQLCLAFILLTSLKLWKNGKPDSGETGNHSEEGGNKPVLKSLAPWLSVLMFFVYSGAEFSVGLWANSMLVESRAIPKETSGLWISYYYGALMVGRFITGIVVNRFGNRALIRTGLIIGVIGALLVYFPHMPHVAMMGLMLMGFGFAPIYPCMMHETPHRFGEDTARVLIGYQVGAACLGGSMLSAAVGLILSIISLEALVPCLIIFLISMILLSEGLNRLKTDRYML